ncbi:unnamed protein product [Schistosoma turkestanicum]|nr:unnamed protein product [Schistosoma turkestanicum]
MYTYVIRIANVEHFVSSNIIHYLSIVLFCSLDLPLTSKYFQWRYEMAIIDLNYFQETVCCESLLEHSCLP